MICVVRTFCQENDRNGVLPAQPHCVRNFLTAAIKRWRWDPGATGQRSNGDDCYHQSRSERFGDGAIIGHLQLPRSPRLRLTVRVNGRQRWRLRSPAARFWAIMDVSTGNPAPVGHGGKRRRTSCRTPGSDSGTPSKRSAHSLWCSVAAVGSGSPLVPVASDAALQG